jgi:hypothetical protein
MADDSKSTNGNGRYGKITIPSWMFASLVTVAIFATGWAIKVGAMSATVADLKEKAAKNRQDIELLKEEKVDKTDFNSFLTKWDAHCKEQSTSSTELAATLGRMEEHLKNIDDKLSFKSTIR